MTLTITNLLGVESCALVVTQKQDSIFRGKSVIMATRVIATINGALQTCEAEKAIKQSKFVTESINMYLCH